MKAIRIHQTGAPEVLRLEQVAEPTPAAGEVLVQVAAAGVNFIDTYHRSGAYPLKLPATLGLEGAGTVVEADEDFADVQVGDRVAWAGARASYAELVAVPSERVVPVPDDVDEETAAAVMLQGMTAHYLACSTFNLGADHTAVIYAAAGGVGRLLVQLAKRQGARVIACTSTAEKEADVRSLGADHVIRYRDTSISEGVRDLTDGRGADVVYDSVGADTFDESLRSLRPRGFLVLFGQSSGAVPPVDPQVLNERGSLYLTRPSLFDYIGTREELLERGTEVLELVGGGQLKTRLHARYAFADASKAHADLESGGTAGKLLLVPER